MVEAGLIQGGQPPVSPPSPPGTDSVNVSQDQGLGGNVHAGLIQGSGQTPPPTGPDGIDTIFAVNYTGPQGPIGPVGGLAISYEFNSSPIASPGAGELMLNASNQSTATTLKIDNLDNAGADWTSVILTFDDANNAVKGHIRLISLTDPTKWLLFELATLTQQTGYFDLGIICIGYSSSSPFTHKEVVSLTFSRSGDNGAGGGGGSGNSYFPSGW